METAMTTQQGLNEVVINKVQRMIENKAVGVQATMERLVNEGKIAQDYIAPIGVELRRNDHSPIITFSENGHVLMNMQSGQYTLHGNAIGQLADKMGIPSRYLRQLASGDEWQRQLAATVLNEHSGWTQRTRVLIRTVGQQVRGVLSDSYRRLNSVEILTAFVQEASQQGAVSNYEKKHGLKDGKQVKGGASAEHNDEPDNQHGNGDNDTPAWAKAIIDGQKSLSDRLAAIEGDKVTASRKQKFDAIIGKLPEDLRKPYARTDIKSISDEEFDTLLSEVGTEVEELAKTANARGAVFGRPATGGATKTTTNGVKEATDEEAQRVVDGMNIG